LIKMMNIKPDDERLGKYIGKLVFYLMMRVRHKKLAEDIKSDHHAIDTWMTKALILRGDQKGFKSIQAQVK